MTKFASEGMNERPSFSSSEQSQRLVPFMARRYRGRSPGSSRLEIAASRTAALALLQS